MSIQNCHQNRRGEAPECSGDSSVRTTDISVLTEGEALCTSFACVTNKQPLVVDSAKGAKPP